MRGSHHDVPYKGAVKGCVRGSEKRLGATPAPSDHVLGGWRSSAFIRAQLPVGGAGVGDAPSLASTVLDLNLQVGLACSRQGLATGHFNGLVETVQKLCRRVNDSSV